MIVDLKTIAKAIIEDNHCGFQGVKTGIRTLDLMGGFRDKELIVLGARPSMGKTAFALSIIEEIALKNGEKCIYFSPEQSGYWIGRRLISIREKKWRHYENLSTDEYDQLCQTVEDIKENVLLVDDRTCPTSEYIRTICKENMKNGRIRLVVVDYLQLCHKEGNENNESLLRDLKSLAEELDCPVLVLSQISRKPESREDKRPCMSDITDMNNVEEIADEVLFLYRDGYYNRESTENSLAEIIIARNQHGQSGTIIVPFYEDYAGFGHEVGG